MVIRRYARLADKESAAPNKPVVAIHPDVEILARLTAGNTNKEALDNAASL